MKIVYTGKREGSKGKLVSVYLRVSTDGELGESLCFKAPLVKWHGIGQVYEVEEPTPGQFRCGKEPALGPFYPEGSEKAGQWWAKDKEAHLRVRIAKEGAGEKSRNRVAELCEPLAAMMRGTDALGRRMIKVMVLEALDNAGGRSIFRDLE